MTDEATPIARTLRTLRTLAALRRGAPLHESSETEAVWLDRAADEIGRLQASERRLSALLGEHIEAADDKHDALAVALEAAEKDAARYRAHLERITTTYAAYRRRGVLPAPTEYADVVRAIEDAAIDAAMAT